MYPLASLSHYESLSLNKWGIREFSEEEISHLKSTRELDVIIVPGLAFDAQGRRIGHGRGYYDRFITECEKKAKEMGRQRPLTDAFVHCFPSLLISSDACVSFLSNSLGRMNSGDSIERTGVEGSRRDTS